DASYQSHGGGHDDPCSPFRGANEVRFPIPAHNPSSPKVADDLAGERRSPEELHEVVRHPCAPSYVSVQTRKILLFGQPGGSGGARGLVAQGPGQRMALWLWSAADGHSPLAW